MQFMPSTCELCVGVGIGVYLYLCLCIMSVSVSVSVWLLKFYKIHENISFSLAWTRLFSEQL